jgi:hypothetical protein
MNPDFRGKGKVQGGTKFTKTLYFSTMHSPMCLNCENPLVPGQNFCPGCGQNSTVHRLSMHDVGHDALHYFTHADKSIFSLIWQLFRKPGLVPREYVAGKRKKYFPPLNFFLVVAAVCLFMTSMLHSYRSVPVRQSSTSYSTNTSQLSPAVQQRMERGRKVGVFFSKYTNLVSMAAIPLMTLIVFLFYSRGKYNYTEHLVANMYIGGFTVLMYALIFLPAGAVVSGSITLYLFFGFELIYRVVAYYYFINMRTGKGIALSIMANVTTTFAWIGLSYFCIRMYISHGFWGLLT